MRFYSNPMDVGMINYPETYHLFMSQKNFSYFSIPDFWGLKSSHIYTDLKVNATPFTPKSNNLIITGDIVKNLNKLVDNKIVFQDKQSSFFDFTDQTLFKSLE